VRAGGVVDTSWTNIRLSNGTIIGIGLDITARKRAEVKLREAKDYAEQLIQTANVIVLGLDRAGRVQVFNEAAERVTGYTRAEVVGKDYFDIFLPRRRFPDMRAAFELLLTTGLPIFENPIITKSGEKRLISWRNSQIREEGEVVATISFGMDITERKRAEEVLRESEARYRTLVEQCPLGIATAGLEDLRIVQANPALCRLLGYTEAEILAMTVAGGYHASG
jgi:PAS domain S-box-containing protein